MRPSLRPVSVCGSDGDRVMNPTLASVSRWSLLGGFVSGVVVGTVWGGGLDSSDLILITLVAYVVVGLLVSQRRPNNAIGWVFLLIGGFVALSGWADAFITRALAVGQPDAWYGVLGAWLTTWFWYPTITLATLFTVLLFPDGLPSPRWRPLLWTSVVAVCLFTLVSAMAPTLVVSSTAYGPEVPNPFNPGLSAASVSLAETILGVIIGGCGLLAVVGAVLRTRRAHGVERQQMKVFAAAAVIAVAWATFGADAWEDYSLFSGAMLTLTIGLLPISCGIAILRYHLYDIDRVISRTTSYAIVTGLVLATYAAVVTLTTRLLPRAGSLPVAVATLTAAALFRPALRRVQDAVDRRFNRSRFDARRTLDAYAERLRHEVNTQTVSDDLVGVVQTSLAPATVVLWLPM